MGFPRELKKLFPVGIYWKSHHYPPPIESNRFTLQLKEFMSNEFTLALARVKDSIMRVPDRMSNPKGEALRTEYVRIFGMCVLGHEYNEGGLYLTLPFQTALLTDPVLYIIGGGLLVLDHLTRSGQSEFAFGNHAHVFDLRRHLSLYENRHPRIIACARKSEEIVVSWMLNRLMNLNFNGPFAKEAA